VKLAALPLASADHWNSAHLPQWPVEAYPSSYRCFQGGLFWVDQIEVAWTVRIWGRMAWNRSYCRVLPRIVPDRIGRNYQVAADCGVANFGST